MKRKANRNIPDFSRKQPNRGLAAPEFDGPKAKQQPPRSPAVKPQATSSKSGRRGQ